MNRWPHWPTLRPHVYSIATDGSPTVLRYPGLCEFVGDGGLRRRRGPPTPRPRAGPGPGARCQTCWLCPCRLRAELVLHASACGSVLRDRVRRPLRDGQFDDGHASCAPGGIRCSPTTCCARSGFWTPLAGASGQHRDPAAGRCPAAGRTLPGAAGHGRRPAPVRPTIHTVPQLSLAASSSRSPTGPRPVSRRHRLTGSRHSCCWPGFRGAWAEPSYSPWPATSAAGRPGEPVPLSARRSQGPPLPADLAAELLAALGSSLGP